MQIGASGQHRQRFMGGIAAHCGTEIHRMQRLLQEVKIGAVGIVHKKGKPETRADICKAPDIRQISEIIRRGDENSIGKPGTCGKGSGCICSLT